jgi:hypothetical protein
LPICSSVAARVPFPSYPDLSVFHQGARLREHSLGGVIGAGVDVVNSADVQFTGRPNSLTDAATSLPLPIGEITREAATLAFKDVFSEG